MLITHEDLLCTTPTYTVRQLEEIRKNLQEKGCAWPLMKWRDFLADDFCIYKICSEEGIRYSTEDLWCEKATEVIPTVICKMLRRGNLTPFQRCEILSKNRKWLGLSYTNLAKLAGVSQEDFDEAEQLIFLEDEESLEQAIENRIPIHRIFQNLMDRCDLEELRNDLRVFLNNFNERDKKSYVLGELRKLAIKHEAISASRSRRK